MAIAVSARASDRLIEVERAGAPLRALLAEIVRAFHGAIGFDRCAVMTTDPKTLLPSDGVVEGFDPAYCARFWDSELLDPDFLKFTALARNVEPIGTLYEATDGDLARSPRYQKLYAQVGADDELRAAFVSGTSCLGVAMFIRPAGGGPFRTEEIEAVRQLVPAVTRVLRRSLGRMRETEHHAPVVVLLDRDGQITGMTQGAERVLEELALDVDTKAFPRVIHAAATKVRASRAAAHLTTRVRSRSGQWLRLHVSPMSGDDGAVAVTIESAGPADLVRILLESYGLTPRETEIVTLLCRGLSAREIGNELIISVHTVRDHIKAIYEKAEVSSRGELVAKLFTNHVLKDFHERVAHVA